MSSSRKPVTRPRNQRERGFAIMFTALMLVVIIPIVGLAIDAGVLYVIRARLTAACDAASLATARNLNLGLTLAEQIAGATANGNRFFAANFPSGYMGTTNTTNSISVVQSNMSTLTVTTTAQTSAPLYFMRFFGNTATVAGAVGKASRRDVNLMLVLDRSGSMAGTPCSDMIAASKSFVNMFVNGRDTLGMVSFATSLYNAYPPTTSFKSATKTLSATIDQISCNGGTNTVDAYWSAYQQLRTINEPLALNMIVLFTDGVPTAFSADFPIKTVSDTRYGDGVTINNLTNPSNCGTGQQCTLAKSTCIDDNGRSPSSSYWGTFAPKTGVMVAGGNADASTGPTYGIAVSPVTTVTSPDPLLAASGCAFPSNWNALRRDVAYIPFTNPGGLSMTGYKSVIKFTSSGHPYRNYIRPDIPANVGAIAANLIDNAAATVRGDTTYNPITFTIGLGNVDDTLLERIANDPASPIYDNSKPAGLYVYAPNSTDLSSAFYRIASEILRLAQ